MVANWVGRTFTGVVGAGALILSAKKAGLDVGAQTIVDLVVAFGPVVFSIMLAVFAGYLARNAAASIAVLVVLATFSLEMALFKEVAESVVAKRVERQAAVRRSNERRQELQRQLAQAERAVPTSSQRLDNAIAAERAVRAKRAEAAAKRGCRKGCIAMFAADAKAADGMTPDQAYFTELPIRMAA